MPTKLQIKKNLEANIKASRIASGGMEILYCGVDIDPYGKLTVQITVRTGSLPREGVEGLIMTAFESVGIKTFVKEGWDDINIKHGSGTAEVIAYGFST